MKIGQLVENCSTSKGQTVQRQHFQWRGVMLLVLKYCHV